MRGTMVWFNETQGVGFIENEDGERFSVQASSFADGAPQGRCGGLPVVFEVSADGGEPRATGVRLETELAPRRARRRGGSFR